MAQGAIFVAIPRVVHQTARSLSALPPDVLRNHQASIERNPGWEFRFYEDVEMLGYLRKRLSRQAFELCERVNRSYGVLLADLFRYLVVYHEGGVYLDVKTHISAPLDQALRPDDQFILSQWRNKPGERYEGWGKFPELAHVAGGEFQQWHVMGARGHPFLQRVIEDVLRNMADYSPQWHGVGKMAILRLSGPICYTLAIGPLLHKCRHRLVDVEQCGINYTFHAEPLAHMWQPGHYSQINQPVLRPP